MAKFYPTLDEIKRLKVPPTQGEYFLIKFLATFLDDSFEVYFQPHINGSHPDVVIMRPSYGIFVIEVKDWNLNLYDYHDTKSWEVRTGAHQKSPLKNSPVEQVKRYRQDCFDLYLRDFYERAYFDKRLYGIIGTGLFFSRASDNDIASFEIRNKPFPKHIQVFGYETLEHKNRFMYILRKVHLLPYKSFFFDDHVYREFHRILLPTMHTKDDVSGDRVILSKKQHSLAISKAGRRTKIRGVAGSGKTRVLAQLAVNAYLRTRAEVLVLTFNIALCNYIHDAISHVREKFPWNQFIIMNYHAFIGIYWNEYLENTVRPTDIKKKFILPKAPYKYQTILVDEIQDYQKEWVESIYLLLAENGELVFFGDEKQNIYSRSMIAEKDSLPRPYTGIGGQWHMLSETYRMENDITFLANSFQKNFFSDRYDFDPIRPVQQNLFSNKSLMQYYFMDEFSTDSIFKIYRHIALNELLNDNDICFLCSRISPLRRIETEFLRRAYKTTTTFENEEMFKKLQQCQDIDVMKLKEALRKIRRSKKFNFHMEAGKIKLATIHSFKGWELTTVILIVMNDKIDDIYDAYEDSTLNKTSSDELIYTALTRARNNLIVINIGNEKYHEFFSEHMVSYELTRI